MSAIIRQPEIGQWYQRRDSGELFHVTGIDEDAGTVEIQSADGSIDELDQETWRVLPPEWTGASEDRFAPGQEMEADDLAFLQAEHAFDDPALLARLP